jgi:hypothetical protein
MIANIRPGSSSMRATSRRSSAVTAISITAGLDGLIRRLGQSNLPVLLHPDFWNRRRVQIPGQEPREIPTTSRSALQGAGFTIIEERQPSFSLTIRVLITGEVDRTTGYERAARCRRPGTTTTGRLTRWSWTIRPSSSTSATVGW